MSGEQGSMPVDGWYFERGGLPIGPSSRSQLAEMNASGALSPSVLVWRDSRDERLTLEAVIADIQIAPRRLADLPAPDIDWTDVSPHPWRRWAARHLDNVIFGYVLIFVIFYVYGARQLLC